MSQLFGMFCGMNCIKLCEVCVCVGETITNFATICCKHIESLLPIFLPHSKSIPLEKGWLIISLNLRGNRQLEYVVPLSDLIFWLCLPFALDIKQSQMSYLILIKWWLQHNSWNLLQDYILNNIKSTMSECVNIWGKRQISYYTLAVMKFISWHHLPWGCISFK